MSWLSGRLGGLVGSRFCLVCSVRIGAWEAGVTGGCTIQYHSLHVLHLQFRTKLKKLVLLGLVVSLLFTNT